MPFSVCPIARHPPGAHTGGTGAGVNCQNEKSEWGYVGEGLPRGCLTACLTTDGERYTALTGSRDSRVRPVGEPDHRVGFPTQRRNYDNKFVARNAKSRLERPSGSNASLADFFRVPRFSGQGPILDMERSESHVKSSP